MLYVFSWNLFAFLSITYLAMFFQEKQKSSQRKIHKSFAKQFIEITLRIIFQAPSVSLPTDSSGLEAYLSSRRMMNTRRCRY